jgi:hemerythrin
MSEALHTAPVRTGEKTIDIEHDVQVQLLDSLATTLEMSGDSSPARFVLEQFIEFSDMHFLSEQLVMRLHGYPGYEAHLVEHTRLMKKVRQIRESLIDGEKAVNLDLVRELREWLLSHIATEDLAFGVYLSKKEALPQ